MPPSFLRRLIVLGLPLLLLPGIRPPCSTAEPGDEMLLFQAIPSVIGASKYEQKLTEAPAAVSIVTAEEIREYGYRTLSDVLRSLRSFYVTSDRTNHILGVRGFNRPGDTNNRFLLLVDGLRVNDSIFGAVSIDQAFVLDIDLIDRIEVIRGPSSSLYGTNAFFGVINVITKKGRDLQGTELSGEAGSRETYEGRLTWGRRFPGGAELLVSGTWHESEGDDDLYFPEFDAPETNHGLAEDDDETQAYSLFAKLAFGDFTLEGALVDRRKWIPTAPYGTVFDHPRNRSEGRKGIAQLKYERYLLDDWNLEARLGYNYTASDGYFVYDVSPTAAPLIIVNRDEFRGEWWDAQLQAARRISDRHRLLLGAEYRDQFRQDQKNFDLQVYLDEEDSGNNSGFFIQDEYRPRQDLTFILGVRRDHYDTFGSTTNPRLAAIYNPRPRTTLKLLYGEAFRAPSAFELYYHDGPTTQKPNPDLDPETIATYELVWEEYVNDRLRGVLSGFYYEIDDLVNFSVDPDDGLVFFENLDEVEAWGVEFEVEGESRDGVRGRLSYTYQDVENRADGRQLSNSPRHLAKLNLILPLLRERLLLGIEELYTGSRRSVERQEIGGFALTNLTLSAPRLAGNLEIAASVYNLFDKEYDDPASPAFRQETLPREGRIFRLKLTYLF